ncbi:C-type lectin domain family 4 member G isoform X2 [Castor canadensis]|uniref:C-type lectin domain family 4 member G isoform X2 n=1 Tax=Castor canadensis TaxID=51338 RepID=A0A8B7V2M3_CASCN
MGRKREEMGPGRGWILNLYLCPRLGVCTAMDTVEYTKWDSGPEEAPKGHWGHWQHCRQRLFSLALALLVATVLWALILSILLSKASKEQGVQRIHQDQLRTNASMQFVILGALKEEVGACKSCCSGTNAQLQTTLVELGETHKKLMQQESTLNELREQVTQGLAKAGRNLEDIRTELFRELEAVRHMNSSCDPCPTSWLTFQGSCYYFSEPKATWEAAQSHCAGNGSHLVIIGNLEEQDFLSKHTRGQGYWLGLRAMRHLRKIRGYQWVDGVSLTFSHWNSGEPNDSQGREDCVMMLHSGLWNDAPCASERDGWICEKRSSC